MRKEFSIETAKSGAKVVTRDGRPVRILDFSFRRGPRKIVAAIPGNHTEEERIYLFDEEGKFELDGQQSENDLFIEYKAQYRSYSNAEEIDVAIKEHGLLVKHRNGMRKTIRGYNDEEVAAGAGYSYEELLEYFTWLDGTPCGILEGGTDE